MNKEEYQFLEKSWNRCCSYIRIPEDGIIKKPRAEMFRTLISLYTDQSRKYHNLNHIYECLSILEKFRFVASYPTEIEIAIWFHDSVYDVFKNDNEHQSAVLMNDLFKPFGVKEDQLSIISRLILATKPGFRKISHDETVIADIDLSILGSDASRFDEYDNQIIEEYSPFCSISLDNEKRFFSERKKILQNFYEQKMIYQNDVFIKAFDKQARINLANVLKRY